MVGGGVGEGEQTINARVATIILKGLTYAHAADTLLGSLGTLVDFESSRKQHANVQMPTLLDFVCLGMA